MAKRMLIDATHPEETRVVVVDGNKLEEFDFEAANRRQLIGNIYLAKVMRVEPSLQAAFVEYGGNRHGFLAFNEIHPDYYQIPIADRQALLEQQAAAERDAAEREQENGFDQEPEDGNGAAQSGTETGARDADSDANGDEPAEAAESVSMGAIEPLEEFSRPRPYRRSYKIQEVIKKRQILLVQVMKDERGTKGAALTTYLSLPGRYCVLMPNTARGGGISRKITKPVDRKKLKSIAMELDVPEGMGLIIRTAGANRTKAEIKRDFESLLRLWEDIRDRTLKSTAPTLIYEEGNLIKRAIRDLYAKDIESIIVDGEDGYRKAKTFMRMLMPSHAKNVQLYKERVPLFQRSLVESQIYSMFNPVVQLRSGGYVVFDQTEALVAIDVNSGRATREHNIEATAYNTNLEAAEEISRQLRLRDLAGLIVIDFIDMEENRNIRAVERRLKDCLKSDRARIQVGRISAFGLMEMSRQRLRTGVVETTTQPCPHCHGTGLIRSVESTALHILRSIEEECLKGRAAEITVTTPVAIALYILNQKRAWLARIEAEYALTVLVSSDPEMVVPDFRIDRTRAREAPPEGEALPILPTPSAAIEELVVATDAEDEEEEDETEERESASAEDDGKRKRRRRRRRRRRGEPKDGQDSAGEGSAHDQSEFAAAEAGDAVPEPVAFETAVESGAAPVAFDQTENPEAAVQPDDLIEAVESSDGAAEASEVKPTRGRRGGGRSRTRRPRKPRGEAGAAEASAEGTAEADTPTEQIPVAPSWLVEPESSGETLPPVVPSEAPPPVVATEPAGEPDFAKESHRFSPVMPPEEDLAPEAGASPPEEPEAVPAVPPEMPAEQSTDAGPGAERAVEPEPATEADHAPEPPVEVEIEPQADDYNPQTLEEHAAEKTSTLEPVGAEPTAAQPEKPRAQRRGWWQLRSRS